MQTQIKRAVRKKLGGSAGSSSEDFGDKVDLEKFAISLYAMNGDVRRVFEGMETPAPTEVEILELQELFNSLAIKSITKKNISGDKVYEDYNIPGGPIMAAKEVLDSVCTGSIKTLPYFKISSPMDFLSSILLFIAEPKASGLVQNLGMFNSIFTGEYFVTGFKHTISSSEVTSEFKVTRKAAPVPTKKKLQPILQPILQDEIEAEIKRKGIPEDPGISLEEGKQNAINAILDEVSRGAASRAQNQTPPSLLNITDEITFQDYMDNASEQRKRDILTEKFLSDPRVKQLEEHNAYITSQEQKFKDKGHIPK